MSSLWTGGERPVCPPCQASYFPADCSAGWEYIWIAVLILLLIILLHLEHADHDCIPGKHCNHYCSAPKDDDNADEAIDKIKEMVYQNYDFVTWRQALIMAIIIPLPIIYYLKGRLPTPIEWFIVGLFVFLAVYLSFSWIWAHFFKPNGKQVEKGLEDLRQIVHRH